MVIESISLIEIAATDLLHSFFVEQEASRLCGRIGKPGKIRDFELKINLLLALGLISNSEFECIDTLRTIRNGFGHDPEPPWILRRLQLLRRWSHEEVEQVLT
jgi:DNA-binding MltR family transcriptional regulator